MHAVLMKGWVSEPIPLRRARTAMLPITTLATGVLASHARADGGGEGDRNAIRVGDPIRNDVAATGASGSAGTRPNGSGAILDRMPNRRSRQGPLMERLFCQAAWRSRRYLIVSRPAGWQQ